MYDVLVMMYDLCYISLENLAPKWWVYYLFSTGPPVITTHPTGGDVPMGRSITLMCRASGLGITALVSLFFYYYDPYWL